MLIWIDTALWEVEWRTSVREGSFLFPSISFFFLRSSILPRGEAKLFAWSFCLPLTNGWCDCGAFEWAKRQELYLEIQFSTSSLRFLGRYAESLLAPVCVLKERKAASVRRFPLSSVGSQNLRCCLTSSSTFRNFTGMTCSSQTGLSRRDVQICQKPTLADTNRADTKDYRAQNTRQTRC